MKSFLVLASLAASALAQGISIGAPADRTTVSPGQNFTVEVDRPDTITGSSEVAIAIGLWACGDKPCGATDVTQVLGNVVYQGPYNPQFSADPSVVLPPHQNFSVQMPSFFTSGEVSLAVAHFSLVGASFSTLFEVRNVTLIIP